MKRTHKVERFDYSKDLTRDDMQFFGIHPKSGRLHIDTKRYKMVLEYDGATEFLPDGLFKNRNTVYFIPQYKSRYDYKYNIFRDMIDNLKKEWQEEYKPLFQFIKTPKNVYEDARLGGIAYALTSDDIEDVNERAFIKSAKRQYQYQHVYKSLYCSFISKITSEVDRIVLNVLIEAGYKEDDYNYGVFLHVSEGIQNDKKGIKIEHLKNYNDFNKLHKINNFIKHNTVRSYEELKRYFPKNVASVENGMSKKPYENGMYACNWIIVDYNYIDELLDNLIYFFEDYCKEFLKEKTDEADWNYDDYFRNAFYTIKDLDQYWGLDF